MPEIRWGIWMGHGGRCFYLILVELIVVGCSRVPSADDGFVNKIVANRMGTQTEWRQGYSQDEQVKSFIQYAIHHELTADSAIQVALLHNPKIQTIFEELGMAQANLVEAGLLSNPSFEIEARYPQAKGLRTNIEYFIVSSLLDIFLIPLRTRLAETEFAQAKLRVANEILNLSFDVREVYFELVCEKKKIMHIKSALKLTGINRDIVARQVSVGNVNILEFELTQSRFLEAELELSKSQAEMIRLTEKLNRLLGLTEEVGLLLPDNPSPDFEDQCFDFCTLKSVALVERLDLQVARLEIARLSRILRLKEGWTYTNLKGGLAGERDTDGANLMGPGLSGELPIFNCGQAARIRLFAQLRQAQDLLEELEIKVISEVREAYKLLQGHLEIIRGYRYRLLPMHSKILSSSEELYNVMGLGIDKLLENKRQEVVAHQNYVESIKKYLLARVVLDRALGGVLSGLLTQQECVQGVGE